MSSASIGVSRRQRNLFPNIDIGFLTLTDLDAQSLIDEVMKGDVYSFIMIVTTTMDKRLDLVALDLQLEDDLVPNRGDDKGPSSSSANPPKGPRSRTTIRKRR